MTITLTDADLVTAANDDDPAGSERPYWQDEPCPPWCLRSIPHQDRDQPDDRFHMGVFCHLPLTLGEVSTIWSADSTLLSVDPPFITAGLFQDYREREARVVMVHAGTRDIELTLAQATELAEILSGLVRQARNPGGISGLAS